MKRSMINNEIRNAKKLFESEGFKLPVCRFCAEEDDAPINLSCNEHDKWRK